jgi:hypothetical protein
MCQFVAALNLIQRALKILINPFQETFPNYARQWRRIIG